MSRTWAFVGLGALLLVGGAYIASPFYAVKQFRSAAEAGDVAALEGAVDFPAVRRNLKSQLTAALNRQMRDDPEMAGKPFAKLSRVMAPALVGQVVNRVVTPGGMAKLVKNGGIGDRAGKANGAGPLSVNYGYSGLNQFHLRLEPEKSARNAATLYFERQGLFGWQVKRVELPLGALEQTR